MELVILGSGGGPQPNPRRSAPAVGVLHDGAAYVIDCGNGVARQLVSANIRLRDLRGVFVTHHHIDHNADLGNLVALSWTAGLVEPVDMIGPTLMSVAVDDYLTLNRVDVEHREALGRPALSSLMRATDVEGDGPVLTSGDLTVRAARVEHPPLEAYAYRFDTPSGSVVVSGDTAPCDSLVELAEGVNILVHEAYSPEHIHLLIDGTTAAIDRLQHHFAQAHTTAEDAGRVAAKAGVKTLVLWHLIPTDGVSDEEWRQQAARHFDGEIHVAADLMRLTPGAGQRPVPFSERKHL